EHADRCDEGHPVPPRDDGADQGGIHGGDGQGTARRGEGDGAQGSPRRREAPRGLGAPRAGPGHPRGAIVDLRRDGPGRTHPARADPEGLHQRAPGLHGGGAWGDPEPPGRDRGHQPGGRDHGHPRGGAGRGDVRVRVRDPVRDAGPRALVDGEQRLRGGARQPAVGGRASDPHAEGPPAGAVRRSVLRCMNAEVIRALQTYGVPEWAMTTDRRFSRFSKSPATAAFSVTEIPDEGVCLSAFLIVTEAHDPKRVLMGHMNPKAPWDHIGALDPSRVQEHSRCWMLPSSHLIFRESPDEAARRIAREQLELPDLALSGPNVVSEVYTPRRFPGTAHHWDIEFLFRGQLAATDATHPSSRTELAFLDLP